jgi:arylsulfatase A-like enzyme
MRHRATAVAVLAVLVACRRDALPPQVTLEEVVAELAPPLATGAVIDEPSPGAVHADVLQPGQSRPGEGPRESLVVPPPSTITLRLPVPPDAVLRFSVGVAGTKNRESGKSGVRFRVLVDGRERFSKTLNPAARQRHRQWVDASVDLHDDGGRTVEAVLETRAEDPALPLAGIPGWSHVRLVRQSTHERQRASAAHPNVLVLLVDTLRADHLGVYGADPSPSPTLDRFAGRGLVFEDSVSQSSWTMPSVASILTGLHPRSHGAPGMRGVGGEVNPETGFLADALVTWPELAQRAGLTTVAVSANPLMSGATNLAQGFETLVELPWGSTTDEWSHASDVNRLFLDWLARHRAWRFVAYLHYMEPHDPYWPPESMRPPPPPGLRPLVAQGRVAKTVKTKGAAPLSDLEVEYLRGLYAGEVRAWDEQFASLLRGLESAGVLDSTVVMVTADHGEEFMEHGRMRHGSHLYEESIRVPLVLAGPGIPAGRRTDTAQGIDVLPTIAGILGLTPPAALPGRDLLATQTGRDIVSETPSGLTAAGGPTDVVSLRSGHWKLIRTMATGAVELYDLATDPGEHGSDPSTSEAKALADRLDGWLASAPAAPRTTGTDPGLHDKLRALGYVE